MIRKCISVMLAAALVLGTALPAAPAFAGMVGTHDVIAQEQGTIDRERISEFLHRDDVREQLLAHGVTVAEAEARVAALSDSEVRLMADQLDSMPAGASSAWAILGGILLILVITDLMGVTNVFPFINN